MQTAVLKQKIEVVHNLFFCFGLMENLPVKFKQSWESPNCVCKIWFCFWLLSSSLLVFFFSLSTEIKYSWVFNGNRSFLQQDARRFISQRTGNLYVAKVEASDAGNYTCVVRNMMTNVTVFSSPTPVVVRGDGKRRRGAIRLLGLLNRHTEEINVWNVMLFFSSAFSGVLTHPKRLGGWRGYVCGTYSV